VNDVQLAVFGTNSQANYALLKRTVNTCFKQDDIKVILTSKPKTGEDPLTKKFAEQEGIRHMVFSPDWQKYGPVAESVQSEILVRCADAIIAFWDGTASNIFMAIKTAKQQRKKCIIIKVPGKPAEKIGPC